MNGRKKGTKSDTHLVKMKSENEKIATLVQTLSIVNDKERSCQIELKLTIGSERSFKGFFNKQFNASKWNVLGKIK